MQATVGGTETNARLADEILSLHLIVVLQLSQSHGQKFQEALDRADEKFAMLQDSKEEDDNPYAAPPYFFHPQSPVKIFWDMFVGIVIMYSVVILPYRIMFQQPVGECMFRFTNRICNVANLTFPCLR